MKNLKAVCVYCGSSSQVAPSFRQAAHDLGGLLAGAGVDVVYGGGRVGLMGIVADAALAAGGRVIGIIPDHIKGMEVEHIGLSELIVVDSMHTRKRLMVERSGAFIMLPGGIGTVDETVEVLTWRQLGLVSKPVVVVNIDGYWDPFLKLIDHMVDAGFCPDSTRKMLTVVDTVGDIPGALVALAARGDTNKSVETQWL